MLFQSGNLLAHLDVEANILLVQELAGRADADVARAILESVGLAARAHARPEQLSGGELARAGLAVALANDPPLLLADEPTGELDSRNLGRDRLAAPEARGRGLRHRRRDP